MDIRFRRLETSDVEAFVELRICQLQEEGARPVLDLSPQLFDYYQRHLADGTFVSWLAEKDGIIIGTSGISFVEKPPYYGNPSGKIGLLSSMYTIKEFRRQGIGRQLLDLVVREARSYGCGTVQITASDAGMLLYTACGFEKTPNFMQYTL